MLTEQDKNFGAFTLAIIPTALLPCLLTHRKLLKDAGNCHIFLPGMYLLRLWRAGKLLLAFSRLAALIAPTLVLADVK